MIVGSIVLVALAVGLLVGGLVGGSELLYVSSIAASMLAAIALVAGVRQFPRLRTAGVGLPAGHFSRTIGRAGVPRETAGAGVGLGTAVAPAAPGDGEDEPSDEPVAQVLPPADVVALSHLDAEVIVVDGRPRYHAADCLHLLGRDRQRLPVGEAVQLGFSPCGQCRPASALLAGPPSA